MSCTNQTLAGLIKECETNKGGIKKVWISTKNPKPQIVDGIIAKFNIKDVDWHEYNFNKNTSSFTSTLNVDISNGVNFVTTELTLQFNKMNTTKRIEMSALSLNEMYVIVLDSNNTYWYLGYDDPVMATSGNSQTGTSKTDGNFYQLVLTDESKTWPYEIANYSYYLEFDANTGEGDVPQSIKFFDIDAQSNISNVIPTKTGYIFCGWSADKGYNSRRFSYNSITAPDNTSSTETNNTWTFSDYVIYSGAVMPERGGTLKVYAQWYEIPKPKATLTATTSQITFGPSSSIQRTTFSISGNGCSVSMPVSSDPGIVTIEHVPASPNPDFYAICGGNAGSGKITISGIATQGYSNPDPITINVTNVTAGISVFSSPNIGSTGSQISEPLHFNAEMRTLDVTMSSTNPIDHITVSSEDDSIVKIETTGKLTARITGTGVGSTKLHITGIPIPGLLWGSNGFIVDVTSE